LAKAVNQADRQHQTTTHSPLTRRGVAPKTKLKRSSIDWWTETAKDSTRAKKHGASGRTWMHYI
jgi:hypothetical protein